MKTRNYTYNTNEFHIHHIDQLFFESDILFDIETTGLSPRNSHIYMIGLGYRIGDFIHIKLFYASCKEEEPEILTAFIDTVKDYKRIITFNGDTFDLPFIKKRCEAKHILFDDYHLTSLDLFKLAKSYKRFLNLEHYKQKDLEHFFGIFREDTFSGGELIELYNRQDLYPNDEEEDLLFLHNMEDIKGMVSLLSLLDFSALENLKPDVSDISSNDKELTFSAKYEHPLNLSFTLLNRFGFIKLKDGMLFGSFNLYDGKMKYYLPNYKDYYYVEDEELLLPKALKSTVNKERIRKATKEECFILTDPALITPEKLSDYIKQLLNDK